MSQVVVALFVSLFGGPVNSEAPAHPELTFCVYCMDVGEEDEEHYTSAELHPMTGSHGRDASEGDESGNIHWGTEDDSCADTHGLCGEFEEEELLALEKLAVSGSTVGLTELIARVDGTAAGAGAVTVNAGRRALQVLDCEQMVMRHITLTEAQLTVLLDQ